MTKITKFVCFFGGGSLKRSSLERLLCTFVLRLAFYGHLILDAKVMECHAYLSHAPHVLLTFSDIFLQLPYETIFFLHVAFNVTANCGSNRATQECEPSRKTYPFSPLNRYCFRFLNTHNRHMGYLFLFPTFSTPRKNFISKRIAREYLNCLFWNCNFCFILKKTLKVN